MEYFWDLIAPYVLGIGGSAITGLITFIVIRVLVGKIVSKNTQTLTQVFNVDLLTQKVAEKFAGRTLNIDVTALTEKALRKLAKELDTKVAKIEDATNSLKALLIAIGKGIYDLKRLTDEQKAELTEAIRLLESGYIPPEKEEYMTVILEPIVTADDKEDEETPSGLNFEGV